MTVGDLIKQLQQFDPKEQVCIFDHVANLKDDSGDGSQVGIYTDFEVARMDEDSIPEGSKPWIAISFTNETEE